MNGLARDLFVIHFAVGSNLTGENDVAFFAKHFAGDVALLVLFEIGVEDGIGDQIANFVRMSFGNGFGTKGKAGLLRSHVGGSPQKLRIVILNFKTDDLVRPLKTEKATNRISDGWQTSTLETWQFQKPKASAHRGALLFQQPRAPSPVRLPDPCGSLVMRARE